MNGSDLFRGVFRRCVLGVTAAGTAPLRATVRGVSALLFWVRTSSHLRNPTAIDRMKKLKCRSTGSKGFDSAHFFGAPQQEAIE